MTHPIACSRATRRSDPPGLVQSLAHLITCSHAIRHPHVRVTAPHHPNPLKRESHFLLLRLRPLLSLSLHLLLLPSFFLLLALFSFLSHQIFDPSATIIHSHSDFDLLLQLLYPFCIFFSKFCWISGWFEEIRVLSEELSDDYGELMCGFQLWGSLHAFPRLSWTLVHFNCLLQICFPYFVIWIWGLN